VQGAREKQFSVYGLRLNIKMLSVVGLRLNIRNKIVYGYRFTVKYKDVIGCHGRTASYLTAPAQIPACGITALGSSEILASVKVKLIRYLNWSRKLRNSRFLDIIEFCNLVKYIIAETTFLTTAIQPLI
jgi:predicted fused transcriptional regulator/phosphomethylpyrimidine kinase